MITITTYHATDTIAEQIEQTEREIAGLRKKVEELKALTPKEVGAADAAANAENERQIAEEEEEEQARVAKKQAKVAQKEQWAKDIEAHLESEFTGENLLCSPDCEVCDHDGDRCDIRYCAFCAFRFYYLCRMCFHSKADSETNPRLCVPCADVVASTRNTKKLEESQ